MLSTSNKTEPTQGTYPPIAAVISPGPDNWWKVFRFINELLFADCRVMISVESTDPSVPRGAFVIPLSPAVDNLYAKNPTLAILSSWSGDFDVKVVERTRITEMIAVPAHSVSVGVYGGGGAPFNHAAVLAETGFRFRFLTESDVRAGKLNEVDVFIMPGGGARSVLGQIEPLGAEGCKAVSEFVRRGGMYIGSCAGSYGCLVNADEFYDACPAQIHMQMLNARPARGENPKGRYGFHSPGVGVLTLRNKRPDHPVMYGMPEHFQIVHYNGPVLESTPTRAVAEAGESVGLASFSDFGDRFTPSERFHGEQVPNPRTFIQDCINEERHAVVAGEFGLGRVVAFGSHPEFGFDLAMVEWEQAARMLINAVMWQSWFPSTRTELPVVARVSFSSIPPGHSLCRLITASESVAVAAEALNAQSITVQPGWMKPELAISSFGLRPEEIWSTSLSELLRLTNSITQVAGELKNSIDNTSKPMSESRHLALMSIDRWALDRRGPESRQDLGYQGAIELLTKAEALCQEALKNWQIELSCPTGSYDFLDSNPYHLVGGSYMAAVGHVAGANLLVRAMSAEWSSALLSERHQLVMSEIE